MPRGTDVSSACARDDHLTTNTKQFYATWSCGSELLHAWYMIGVPLRMLFPARRVNPGSQLDEGGAYVEFYSTVSN